MPITLRPYSANAYALAKVWFKCSSVNLRLQDINFINSQVKSWLYQDCLEKPSELILFRESKDGGLGLFSVKIRSLALLIRSFLETSINPLFRHNLYHEILFRYHILGDTSIPNPGYPPFYDKTFFETIKYYHNSSPLNINMMTTKQWYKILLEDKVLMATPTDQSPATLLPCRVELLHPSTDWPGTWALARTTGIGSDLTAFLFRLLHQILPTKDRTARFAVDEASATWSTCKAEREDQLHAFFSCPSSAVSGLALIGYAQRIVSDLSPEKALRLELGGGLDEVDQLAVVCLLSTGLKFIWETRAEKKNVTLFKMRTEIETKITILRKSRHAAAGERMLEIISSWIISCNLLKYKDKNQN